MIIDFIGAFATGFALLGVVLFVNRVLLRGRFGRWIYPAVVASGMVGFTVWAEYTWPTRTLEAQPHLALASQNGESLIYRPWTYIWPQVTRMITVNRAETRTNPEQPDLVMTQVVLLGRWEPVRGVLVVYDCAQSLRADLRDGVAFQEDGTLAGADWVSLEGDDPVLRTACAVRGEDSDARGQDG